MQWWTGLLELVEYEVGNDGKTSKVQIIISVYWLAAPSRSLVIIAPLFTGNDIEVGFS